jgi:RNA polymerase sigma-70 factor (ECF subfamily)
VSATNGFFSTTAAYAAERVSRRLAASKVEPEDETLMMRIQNGDEQALGLLLERYATTVLGIGLKVLRDREEAEELVQDVFFQIYRKCQLYDPAKGSARTWLLRTTYHRAFDRREYLQLRRFYDSRSVDEVADKMCAASDVEYEAQINQREAIVRKAFEELTEKQRETLTLFFFEGYTLREISEQLKESLANIRHYYYRGLRHLKCNLDLAPTNHGAKAVHEL